jgi:hypothetical protein
MNLLARIKQFFATRYPAKGETWVPAYNPDMYPVVVEDVDTERQWVSYRFVLLGSTPGDRIHTVNMKDFLLIHEPKES